MAKFTDGIFGTVSGRIGNVIAYTWRGVPLLRSAPQWRKRYKASKLQKQQQKKFAMVVKFLSPIKDVVGNYFGKPQNSSSRFNLAMSYHLKEAVTTDATGKFVMNYSKVMIADGFLRPIENMRATPVSTDTFKLEWKDNSGGSFSNHTDSLIVVVHAPKGHHFATFDTVAHRSGKEIAISLDPKFQGKEIHIWAAFISPTKKRTSMSTHRSIVMSV